jgi:hypothetical protein
MASFSAAGRESASEKAVANSEAVVAWKPGSLSVQSFQYVMGGRKG